MKKFFALLLALMLALSCAAFAEEAVKESAKAAAEVEDSFSFRNVVGWNSTQEEIMTAFAEFGIEEQDLYVSGMSKEVKDALVDLTYLYAKQLPVAGKKLNLEVFLWKGVPGMYVYDAYLGSDADNVYDGLALKYGEPATDKTNFVSMMGLFGIGDEAVVDYAEWRDGDTLIAYVERGDRMLYNIFYINLPMMENTIAEIADVIAGVAAAEAQAEFDAATAGL